MDPVFIGILLALAAAILGLFIAVPFDQKLRIRWRSIYDSLPHELEHYLDDVDIRAKDSGYAKHQRQQLSLLLDSPPTDQPIGDGFKQG